MALKELARSATVPVAGTTSRGIYLRTSERRMVFIAAEPFCSPWTVLVNEMMDGHQDLPTGSLARVEPGCVQLEALPITVDLTGVVEWLPPSPPAMGKSAPGVRMRLERVAQTCATNKGDLGFAPLLPALLGLNGTLFPEEQQRTLEHIQAARRALQANHADIALAHLLKLMGLGRGLTPSGDDLIAGMLLVYNRWHTLVAAPVDLFPFNQALCQNAYVKTTTLSANIIESATQGIGDERLLLALDGIISTNTDENTCARLLTHYGSSSGVDALAGMVVALSTQAGGRK